MLYRSTDCLSRAGASVEYLAHSASFHSAEKIAPSNSGTKHLARDPEGLVFARPDGSPLDADTLSKAFSKLIKTAKVTQITLHGLRHSHISHLLMDGIHVKVVSERAGHANVNVTLGVYAAYMPNMQADAALRVDAWLR